MLKFFKKYFVKNNLNYTFFNKDGGDSYIYRQRKRTGIVKGIL